MSNEQDKQHLQELAAYRFTVDNLRARVAELEAKLEAAPQAVQAAVPDGWVPCVITYEGQHPEEIAYGPQVMMNRLKKWLDRYFEMRTAPAHPAEGGQDFATLHAQLLNFLGADDHMHATHLIAGHMAREHELTHHTQQGLDSAQKTEVIEHGDCMRVCVIENDGTSLIVPASDFQNHIAEIADQEEPDMEDEVSYTLTFKSMPRADVDALPEFNGF